MHEEDLYRLVCEYSSKEDVLSKEGLKLLSAECLAQKLGIPRNVISAALNKLYGTGALIKINTRPVYYLDRTLLESRFNVTIAQNLFFSIEQFDKILKQNESEKDIFSEIIGFDRSLKFQIKQCKAAAYYPGIGLPVLICGATGTGKSLLAKYMHAFCVQKKLIDSAAPFVTFNCADYADNPELLTGILFGYVKGAFTGADKDHVGLLEKANNGVLFLDEAHRLSGNGQEKLFMFMDQGVFSRLGEGSGERKSKVRLVFATTEEPKNAFLETFLRRIPVTITMPSLEERGHEEVMQIICGLLRNESVTFGRELSVSQDFVKILLSCKFRGNIGELTNIIKYACAEAYHYFCEQDDKTAIYVRSCYLPDKLLKQAAVSQQSAKLLSGFTLERIKISPHFRYENIRRLIEKQHNSQAVQNAYYNVFNSFLAGLNLNQTPKQIMASMENALDGYIDILSEESKDYVSNIQYSVFKTSVDNILDYMIHTDNILLTAGLRGLLVSHFYRKLNYMNMDSILPAKLADDIKMFFFQQYPQVYGKCSDIFRYFGTSLDVPLKNNDFVILALCLYESANKTKVYHTKALLLARGYSTATSIASVVNRLLEARIFEPFDMPLDLGIEEISRRINMYLKNSNDQQDIIIMTDLNRLQSFDRYIDSGYEGNIAVVNSITTQLALDIGNCILGEMPLVDMLKSSVDKNSTDYLLLRYQPPVRQQAIVTTCFTGMGTAEKLADLLRDTLSLWMPDIRIIPCDYNGLKANGLNESVIKDYSVIMIFGTMDPQIGKIPFVNVGEAMISECGDNKLYHVLSGFIPEQHMEQVNDQLIKNFSLQRVLDYLTILNPERVLTNVEAFIGSLERFLHTKFPNPVKLLLYVHISCLIERLITKKPVPDYKNRPNFAKKQKKFIKVVKDGFSVIEKMYSVEISTEEIGYIYDIVTAKPATSVFEQEL